MDKTVDEQVAPLSHQIEIPLSILIVEDNIEVSAALSRILTAQGHRVVVASGVAEALSLAELTKPDLLFGCVKAEPEPEGLTFVINMQNRYPHTFVAIMGGRIIVITAPADIYLEKPQTLQNIKRAIASFLKPAE